MLHTQSGSQLVAAGAVEHKSLLWQHSVVVGLIYMTKQYYSSVFYAFKNIFAFM